jgi:hypothetical protein
MADLKTTEKYSLAQILVCGAITRDEFKSANQFLGEVQDDTLQNMRRKGLLEQTLYQDNG